MTTTKYFIYACLRMYETQDLLDLIFIFSKFCVSCIMRVVMNYLMLGCVSLCNKKLFHMSIVMASKFNDWSFSECWIINLSSPYKYSFDHNKTYRLQKCFKCIGLVFLFAVLKANSHWCIYTVQKRKIQVLHNLHWCHPMLWPCTI